LIAFEVRRDVIDASLRVGGSAPEIGEVEAALGVEHQVVRQVAGLGRDDGLHPRPVWLHRDDGAGVLEVAQAGDEDAPIFVDGETRGAELVLAHDG